MEENIATNSKFKPKTLILDLLVILCGVLVAIGIFAFLKNIEANKERNSLISNGVTALNNQEYSKAISLFKSAEKEFPDNDEVKRHLGNLYYIKGKYEDSLKYYNSVDKTKLASYELEDIGEIYFERKDYDKAIEQWEGREIAEVNKYKLAKTYYEKERFDDYYKTLEQINKFKEAVILLQIKETNLQNILNNIDAAVTLPAISNDNYNLDLFKSQISEAKKQNEQSKKDYAELIQIAAYGNLNQCRILFSRIEELKKTLESKKITTYQVDYYKGFCYNQVNRPTEAIPLIEAAIKVDSTMIEYRESLAKSFYMKSELERVKQIYTDILTLEKKSQHYENFAIYLYKLGSVEDSLKNYDLALAEEKNKETKNKYAKSVFQINILDLKNLEICRRIDVSELLDSSLNEQNIILGHCKLYINKNLDEVSQNNTLTYSYLSALKEKNKEKINEILDKDTEGLITTYYKAVGENILKV